MERYGDESNSLWTLVGGKRRPYAALQACSFLTHWIISDAYTSCARDNPTRKIYSLLEALQDFTKTIFEKRWMGLTVDDKLHTTKKDNMDKLSWCLLDKIMPTHGKYWQNFFIKGVWLLLTFNRASNLLTTDSYDIWTVFSWMLEHLPIAVEMLVEGICFSRSSSKVPTLVWIQYSSQVTCLDRADVEIYFGAPTVQVPLFWHCIFCILTLVSWLNFEQM